MFSEEKYEKNCFWSFYPLTCHLQAQYCSGDPLYYSVGEFKFKPTIYIWLFLFNGRFIIVLWRKRLILDPDSCFLGNHRFQKVIRRSMILLQAIYAGLLLIYEFSISLFWAYLLGLMTIKRPKIHFFRSIYHHLQPTFRLGKEEKGRRVVTTRFPFYPRRVVNYRWSKK